MYTETLSLLGIGALSTLFYCVIGIGVARMIFNLKGTFSLFCVFVWPIVACVYAYSGDVDL
jgi:hypothetical protein